MVVAPRLYIDKQTHKELLKKHGEEQTRELATVLGGDQETIKGVATIPGQEQYEGEVSFTSEGIQKSKQELHTQGYKNDLSILFHNHNSKSGHGFGWSDQDLETGKKNAKNGELNGMGLVYNGTQTEEMTVQHMGVADNSGEWQDLETEEGNGKIISTITTKDGKSIEFTSETPEEALEKEAKIVQLKTLLQEESNTSVPMHTIIDFANQSTSNENNIAA